MEEERSSRPIGDPERMIQSSSTVFPFPRSAQVYRVGYHDYVRRFNLDFPPGVTIESDGLPRNSVLVFGPNAYPAVYGKEGSILSQLRLEFPDFNIRFYRLNEWEKEVNDQLEIILWIERRWSQGPDGIEEMEAGLMNGLRRFTQFRIVKASFEQPQLMFVNEYFNRNRHEFEARAVTEVQHQRLAPEIPRGRYDNEYASQEYQGLQAAARHEQDGFESRARSSSIDRSPSRDKAWKRGRDEHHDRTSARSRHRLPHSVREYTPPGRHIDETRWHSYQSRSASPKDRRGSRWVRSALPSQSQQYRYSEHYRHRHNADYQYVKSEDCQQRRSSRDDHWV